MKGILCKGVNYFLSKPYIKYQGELDRRASIEAVNVITDKAAHRKRSIRSQHNCPRVQLSIQKQLLEFLKE